MRIALGDRSRGIVVGLTLYSYLMITVGLPLSSLNRKKPTDGVPYPCQSRPCGCLTAKQCWQGDCCCFTLEEKLAWAEANGVEPPEHVRPLVESRRSRPAPLKRKSCCSGTESASALSVKAQPTCCEKRKPGATCCNNQSPCEATADAECPQCASKAKSNCCEKKAKLLHKQSSVRWVVGIFAQKCRGDGPIGWLKLELLTLPAPASATLADQPSVDIIPLHDQFAMSVPHSPPTPPPRFG